MKLLILTQKIDINDDVLGFMHGWVEEFAKHCERVTVICLQKGEYNLPENVKILSLGKEKTRSKLNYIINFYKYIWRERKNYDIVFVHMNKEYVILGGVFWRLFNKKIGLWYAHGYAPFLLRVAEKFSEIIFTSTKSGFRIESRKLNVVGQGIDTEKFRIKNYLAKSDNLRSQGGFAIVTVGRISPSKDYETLILAAEILKNSGLTFNIEIIGGPAAETDEVYLARLKKQVDKINLADTIEFTGSIANKDVGKYLQSADLFVNMGQTGSLDKAIVEAMSCGLPVLSGNESLFEVLGQDKNKLIYPQGDHRELAERIKIILKLDNNERRRIGSEMREIVVKSHSLAALIKKILNSYDKL